MAKVFEQEGFVCHVWPNDHLPPHVHVFRGGREMRIAIGVPGLTPPWIYDAGDMPVYEQKEALKLVSRRQGHCLTQWSKFHAQLES